MLAVEDSHSSRRRPLRIAVAIASAVVLVGGSALALRHGSSPKPVVLVPQATTTVTCGQTITASVVLANDLSCGSGNGLNVGAANVIVNLNGHTLSGPGTGLGVSSPTFATVTIENGTVSGWAIGADAEGSANKVIGIRATGSSTGIFIDGPGSSATGNVAFLNGYGIWANGINEKLTSNVVRENSALGIEVAPGTGAVIQTNQSLNNGGYGIEDLGNGTVIIGNITNGNASDGIHSAPDARASVTTNTANYNAAYGIEASAGGKDGGGNTAKGNTNATQCKDVICA